MAGRQLGSREVSGIPFKSILVKNNLLPLHFHIQYYGNLKIGEGEENLLLQLIESNINNDQEKGILGNDFKHDSYPAQSKLSPLSLRVNSTVLACLIERQQNASERRSKERTLFGARIQCKSVRTAAIKTLSLHINLQSVPLFR